MRYSEYKKQRDSGKSHEEIYAPKQSSNGGGSTSGSSGGSSGSVKPGSIRYSEYKKLRDKGLTHEEIYSGLKEKPAPALEDFANANPLSATVQSLTNQRDAIANATPGEFGKKDKYTDSMSQYMQRRGLAELDTAIQNQTQKERIETLPWNPITGTLLEPIGTATIPMSAMTPLANPQFMERPRPAELGISDLLASGTKNWQQEQTGRAARNKVNPQTVVDVRKQIQDIDNQISQLDTNAAMVALSGTDTSEAAAERQALSDRRDYLTGELNRYQSALQPEFDALTEQISDLAKRFKDSKDQSERFELFDQITNLNAQQKQLMDALGIENKPIVEWDGRDDLIKEFRQLSRADRLNPAQQARLNEVRSLLEEGDALTGNGLQSYSFGDRVSNILQGSARNVGSSLLNAGATWFDAYSRGQSQQYGLGTAVSDQLAGIDPMSRIEMQTEDYNSEESQALRQAMYETADGISEKAREDLEAAKSQLGSVGKAGVDIAENILEMGFDAGIGAMTGGGSLPSMFLRVFGGAAQEARQAGASLDEQLAYAITKGGIEVATEKMFDGVAHIYGAGAADEITEELIRKLADSDTGRTFLRMVISGQGEGIEEVVSELLDPLAKSIYADESVGELYKNVNPADVLYSYIIGSTIGFFGGATEVATGANALSNAELRMRDAGLGVDAQTNNAWDVLTGKTDAETMNQQEREARERLGLDANGNPIAQPTVADSATVQQATENAGNANTNPAADALLDVLQNRRNTETGLVSRKGIDTILENQELIDLFNANSDTQITNQNNANNRAAIRENADAVIAALTSAEEITADTTADAAEAVDGVTVTSGPNVSESDSKGLAKTLSDKVDMIKYMPSVAELTGHEMNDRSKKPMQQILDFFHRMGGKVSRANFGDVSLGQYGADAIINHRPLNRAKMVTVEAVPSVIQHGELIAYDSNWKGRGYASYVFAAPVKVAGKTIYVAAVVNQTDGNHFYLNECIDSNGNYVRIAEAPSGTQKSDLPNKNGITEGPNGASAKEGIPDSGTSSSGQNIPQSITKSNSGVGNSTVVDALVGKPTSSAATRIGDPASQNTPGYELSSADDELNQAVQMASNGVPQSIIQSETGYSVNDSNDFTTDVEGDVDGEMPTAGNTSNGLINDSLVPYSEEMAALIEDRGDVIVTSKDVLEDEVNLAFDNPAEQHVLYFGNIPSDMLETIIKDVPNMPHNPKGSLFKSGKDYSLIASLDSIRHLNDDSDLSREDILRYMDRYADTILDYDDVHYSEYKDHYGNRIDGLRFRKTYADGIQVVYDIISNRKRSLSLKTDFSKNKQKSASTLLLHEAGATTPNNGINTPEARGSQTSVDSSISQPSTENNSDDDNNNPPPPPSGPSSPGGTPAVDNNNSDTVETRERGESRNIRTDEARDQQLRDFKEKNPDIYKVVKNNRTLRKAMDIFDSQGVEGSAQTLERALYDAQNGRKLPLEMVPLHKLVCDELSRQGQVERANRISSDLGAELTYAGQLGQANVILRSASPTAQADAFAKTVERLISENNADIDQESVDDLISRYRSADTQEARDAIVDDAMTAIAQSSPTTFREALNAIRYLNMLGNFKTQIRNVAGNTGMLAMARAKNRILALEQMAWNAAFKNHQITQTNTLTTSPELFREAWNMFAEDRDAAVGEGKYSDVAQGNKAIRDKKTVFKWNWKSESDSALRKIANAPMKVLEAYRKATRWAMEEGDVIFQKVTYAQTLADYAKAQGYSSLQNIDPDTLQTMREHAIREAQEATFHDKNAVSEWFSGFDRDWDAKYGRVGKAAKTVTQGVVPFRQTPANVGVRMEEYSPLGVVNTFVDACSAIKGGDVDVNTVLNAAAKTLSGTGLAVLGYVLAKHGLARGKEDDKELEAYERNVQGLSDYSIVLPDGTSVSLDWFAPESASFFVGVAAADAFKDGAQADDIIALLGSTSDIAMNMSFLSGLQDSLDKLSSFNGNMGALPTFLLNSLISYGGQIATNSLLGQAEQASERYRQTSYSDKEGILPTGLQYTASKLTSKMPGIDYNQADYIDAWGRKQDNGENVAGRVAESFFSPAYINESRTTEIDDELKRLHEATKDTVKGSVLPTVADRSTIVGDQKLTPEEYELYQTRNGQTALKLVSDFINGEGYDSMSDEDRAKVINDLYGFARDTAKNSVLLSRGEQTEKSDYDKARAIKDAGSMSWAQYYQTKEGRDMDGNGSAGAEETAQYLFENFPEDKAKKIFDTYYPDSKTPYEEYAGHSQEIKDSGFTKQEYDTLTATVKEAKTGAESWDSKGDNAVINAVMAAVDKGLSEDGASLLITENTSKYYSNPYSALIDSGRSMQESMDILDMIDAPGKKDGKEVPPDKAIQQAELKAYYKEHPEEEVVIALIWDSMGYTGKNTKDFETYKKTLK